LNKGNNEDSEERLTMRCNGNYDNDVDERVSVSISRHNDDQRVCGQSNATGDEQWCEQQKIQ
jgi:hypothetical protein